MREIHILRMLWGNQGAEKQVEPEGGGS